MPFLCDRLREFSRWYGDTGTVDDIYDASTFITMNGNYEITAMFIPTGTVPLETVMVHHESYIGQTVTIWGQYRGWEQGYGAPPVTKSDWVLKRGEHAIYVTGDSLGLRHPDNIGVWVKVTGIVRVKNGVPYIEIQRQTGRR